MKILPEFDQYSYIYIYTHVWYNSRFIQWGCLVHVRSTSVKNI